MPASFLAVPRKSQNVVLPTGLMLRFQIFVKIYAMNPRRLGDQLLVPPQHTSQRCHVCGHVEAANRASRDHFQCVKCHHKEDADLNAAINIRDKAKGVWGKGDKVQIAASLELLLKQQARPKRSFRKKKQTLTAGLAATACGISAGNG